MNNSFKTKMLRQFSEAEMLLETLDTDMQRKKSIVICITHHIAKIILKWITNLNYKAFKVNREKALKP